MCLVPQIENFTLNYVTKFVSWQNNHFVKQIPKLLQNTAIFQGENKVILLGHFTTEISYNSEDKFSFLYVLIAAFTLSAHSEIHESYSVEEHDATLMRCETKSA